MNQLEPQVQMREGSGTLTCQVLTTTADLHDLRGAWTTLLDGSGIASPFLSWEWMATWWEVYCAGTTDRRLAIVTGRRGGRLVALLPGYVQRAWTGGLPLKEFRLLGTEYESTDYLQVIESGHEPSHVPDLFQALLSHFPDLDLAVFDNVLAGHRDLQALRQEARARNGSYEDEPHRVCPFVEVRGDWESFVSSLSPKMRKNVRRAMRYLPEVGAEIALVSRAEEVRPAVGELFALHARRFVAKEEQTGFRADVRQPFHEAVSERLLERDILRLFRVRHQGQTIAALYCFEYAGELFYFQSGIDPEWEKQSVGTALVGYALKHAFDTGLRRFDFMRGSEEYKFRWTSSVRDMLVARVGLSRRGRAALTVRDTALGAKRLAKRWLKPAPDSTGPKAPAP